MSDTDPSDEAIINLPERTQQAVRYHLRTAAALVQCALGDLNRADAQAAGGVSHVLRAGGLLQLRVTTGTTGYAHLALDVVPIDGEPMELLKLEHVNAH